MKAALRRVVSMNTKKYCIKPHDIALYLQQHPTRLCKQLYPQTVGLLFSNTPKNNNDTTDSQLPRFAGNT